MKLLVTGAAGMLGRDVVRYTRAAEHEAVALARADLDVTDPKAVKRAVSEARPDAVINCAAWTDVDGAESGEAAAAAVNVDGARNVADAAAEAEALVVHVSTDFVFDGAKGSPYVESDPTGPLSAYGRTKLAGEQAVADSAPRHAIVRTSWLFGAGGKNFVATMLSLADERDTVRVVTDQVGCPTWTGHLAPVLVALAAGAAQGVFHVAGAGAASWNALAVETFRLAAVDCRVESATTEDFGRPAHRPAYSVLGTERRDAPRLPPWQDGLAGYLAERASLEAAPSAGAGA